jgi:hypothetical protein
MNNLKPRLLALRCVALSMALPCFLVSANAAQTTKPAATANSGTNTVADQSITKSVFVIPATPKQGRNPFFPYSAQPAPMPDEAGKNTRGLDPSGFVLNGITSPPKRTAMINGRTFELGESGEVRSKMGYRVLIKCEEIRSDSAVISVEGKRIELRLRLGL